MTIDLSLEPTEATPVASRVIAQFAPRRGEVPTGRTITQALTDAGTREVRSELFALATEVAALRENIAKQKSLTTLDTRKLFIRAFAARHPGVPGRTIALRLDNEELRPRPSWIKATKKRLWAELWDLKTHPKTQRAVRKFVYDEAALSPLVTESKREGA
jgi:hypothetical protein